MKLRYIVPGYIVFLYQASYFRTPDKNDESKFQSIFKNKIC
jgi:hypothetical protein